MTKVVVNQVIEYYSQVKFKVKQIVLVRQIFICAWVHYKKKKILVRLAFYRNARKEENSMSRLVQNIFR